MVLRIQSFLKLQQVSLAFFSKNSTKTSELLVVLSSPSRNSHTDSKLDNSIFESNEVQKYLKFISSSNSTSFKSDLNEEVIQLLKEKEDLESEIKNLESMPCEGDKELEKLVESEKTQYLKNIKLSEENILNCLTPKSSNDNRGVELKIIPGIGGDESKLFMKELFEMYRNYAVYKNWSFFELEENLAEVEGDFVFGHLKCEAGVHRVQRVPETEKSGRTHTSTCSVVVLPLPNVNEIQIPERDLSFEKIKSSGPGGQNVNKRETCVRVKHIPTGITVENQTSRYQYENIELAVKRLRMILFTKQQEKEEASRKNLRKEQAGTNDYADKIRTYHFSQNRVTDHRINHTFPNLKGFMSGTKDLDFLVCKIMEANKMKEFLNHVDYVLHSPEYKEFEKNMKKS